jgi:hypothetical protein
VAASLETRYDEDRKIPSDKRKSISNISTEVKPESLQAFYNPIYMAR